MKTKNYIQKAYGKEPEWSGEGEVDPTEILKSINWYNSNSQKKNYKKWAIAWMKDKRSSWTKEQSDIVRRCPQKDFRSFGHYCRMLSRGFPSVDQLTKIVDEKIQELLVAGKQIKESTPPTKTPRQRMEEKLSDLAGDLMNVCDQVMVDIREGNFSAKKESTKINRWLESNKVNHWQADMLADLFAPALAELDDLVNAKESQLKDAYSFLKTTQQKQLYKFMDNLVSSCLKHSANTKPVRKTRKRKIDPSKIISKVKYLKESSEYGLTSVDPASILDSKKVWVFNCRYKTLSVYYASPGHLLSIKGTTIQNFDGEKSESRTIKNATKEMPKVRTEKELTSLWSRQTSVVKTANGRLNENCVILKVS